MAATWAAALAGIAFLVVVATFALAFTRTRTRTQPIEQENPWQPDEQPPSSARPTRPPAA